jgi:hypothetical protein
MYKKYCKQPCTEYLLKYTKKRKNLLEILRIESYDNESAYPLDVRYKLTTDVKFFHS